MSHVAPNATIWWKNQRVWRTIFSYVLGGLTTLPIILGIVNEHYPSEAIVWVIGQLGAVQAIVTRVMAIESVNVWLAHFGLGSAPKSELIK